MIRTLVLGVAILVGVAIASPSLARADGWWEVTCNSDGHEGSGGCTNPDNMSGCTCETGSSASHAASVGSGLAVLGLVAFRLGRKRRR
jgi:hypothetical protein